MSAHPKRRLLIAGLLLAGFGAAAAAVVLRPAQGLKLEHKNRPDAPPVIDRKVQIEVESLTENDPFYRLEENLELEWTGWLYLPRTGNYRFEIESDDGSSLYFGDVRLVDNSGKHPRRTRGEDVFVERGWIPIRIEYENANGGGYFDLRWRLPSGYNTVGRLPRAYLRPDRPTSPGLLERALPALSFICFGIALLTVFRERVRSLIARLRAPEHRATVLAGAGVFLLALGVRAATVGAQSETCDEWAYVGAGDVYYRNVAALQFDAEQWRINREHPPVGKLIYGVAQAAFGGGPTPARLASALLGSLTVLLVFALGRRLSGVGTATIAGLVAALLPPAIAHSNIGTLEAPLAFFYTASIACYLRGLEDDEEASGFQALAWLCAGLAVGTKFTAGLLIPFFYVGWVIWHRRSARMTGTVPMPWGMYVGPVLAALPIILLWPWLWEKTLEHLLETVGHWKNRPGPELFLGELVTDRPKSYFLVWFLAAVPLSVLLTSVLGFARAIRATDRRWYIILVWQLLPFAWSFVTLRQGGYRYVYPAFFPLALLAGFGADWLAGRLLPLLGTVREAIRARVALWVVGAVVVSGAALGALRTAPYFHYYFNEALGGTRGVYDKQLFDIGFWAEGIDPAVAWLNANAPAGATVGLAGAVDHTAFGLRPDLRRCLEARSGCSPSRDYVIRDTLRVGSEGLLGYEQVFAVRTMGAPLLAVYERKPAPGANDAGREGSRSTPTEAGPPPATSASRVPPRREVRSFAFRRPFDFMMERPRLGTRRLPIELEIVFAREAPVAGEDDIPLGGPTLDEPALDEPALDGPTGIPLDSLEIPLREP